MIQNHLYTSSDATNTNITISISITNNITNKITRIFIEYYYYTVIILVILILYKIQKNYFILNNTKSTSITK